MLFNSFSFLIFFPVVVFLYYLLPHRARTVLLLLASSYFYMAFVPKYILVLFFLITADYVLARLMERREGKERKVFLIISILTNLGTLFIFKYFNFFSENVAAVADLLHWNYSATLLSIALPLGLSFHVFQSLSYVIEVYRKRYEAEHNFLTYALYVMFFPQLVAGPIERPQHLLPQFKLEHKLDLGNVRSGLERMLWGFFKKIVIADNLATYVDQVYLHPNEYAGATLLVATVFFAFQIYCDFSGYSDIAIGSARVIGFNLIENFKRPFASTSMTEFWRRWHISLSSWLRDYLYYPLALSAKGHARFRLYWALFITFVLIGLWHGAAWTFVAFGALHGFYLVFGEATKKLRERLASRIGLAQLPTLRRGIQLVVTFALACTGFVFFRAVTFRDALHIIAGSFSGIGEMLRTVYASAAQFATGPLMGLINELVLDGGGRRQFAFFWALIIVFVIAEVIASRRDPDVPAYYERKKIRWALYFIAVIAIMNLGVTHEIPFIYFQF